MRIRTIPVERRARPPAGSRKPDDRASLGVGRTLDGGTGSEPAGAHRRVQRLAAPEQRMTVTEFDQTNAEVRWHRRTFVTFERLVLFAALHIALILSCLALAFVGHIPLIAFLLGVGGTVVLIAGFAVV